MHPTSLGVTWSARGLASLAAHPAPPFTLAGDARSVRSLPQSGLSERSFRKMPLEDLRVAQSRLGTVVPLILCVLLTLVATCCSSYVPLGHPTRLANYGVERGTRIRVHMADGTRTEEVFANVTADTLFCVSRQYELASVRSVEVLDFDEYMTFGIVFLAVLGTAIAVTLAAGPDIALVQYRQPSS